MLNLTQAGKSIAPPSETAQVSPLNILLVEDTFSDVLLTRILLDATSLPYTLRTFRKGNELMPFLNKYPGRIPDVILLDLGLPGMDGFDILADLTNASACLRAIPIVIMTGHKNFEYIRDSYPLCIMAYINKPCKSEALKAILQRIQTLRTD